MRGTMLIGSDVVTEVVYGECGDGGRLLHPKGKGANGGGNGGVSAPYWEGEYGYITEPPQSMNEDVSVVQIDPSARFYISEDAFTEALTAEGWWYANKDTYIDHYTKFTNYSPYTGIGMLYGNLRIGSYSDAIAYANAPTPDDKSMGTGYHIYDSNFIAAWYNKFFWDGVAVRYNEDSPAVELLGYLVYGHSSVIGPLYHPIQLSRKVTQVLREFCNTNWTLMTAPDGSKYCQSNEPTVMDGSKLAYTVVEPGVISVSWADAIGARRYIVLIGEQGTDVAEHDQVYRGAGVECTICADATKTYAVTVVAYSDVFSWQQALIDVNSHRTLNNVVMR